MMSHLSAAQLLDLVRHPSLVQPADVSTGYIGMDIRVTVWTWPATSPARVSLQRLEDADGWMLILNTGDAARRVAPDASLLFTTDHANTRVSALQILSGPFQGHTLTERTGLNGAVDVRSAGYTQAVITAERQVGVRRDPLAAYTLNRTAFCARKHVWCAP